MAEYYFIVLDEAPIEGSPRSKFDLMRGNPETATGIHIASATSVRKAVNKAPANAPVCRVYLERTDGKTGVVGLRGWDG